MSLLPESLFALRLEADKSYSQEVEQPFRISMASLVYDKNATPASDSRLSVCLEQEGSTYVLCNLFPGRLEQQQLDLTITEGETITFSTTGNAAGLSIDLTGNMLVFIEEEEDLDSDIEGSDMEEFIDGEAVEEDTEVDEDSDIEMDPEVMAELEAMLTTKRKSENVPEPATAKKAKIEKKIDAKKVDASPAAKKDEKKKDVASPAEKKVKETPVKKVDEKKAAVVSPAEKKVKETPAKKVEERKAEVSPAASKKKTLPNGLIIEDIVEGTGPKAKKGKKIAARYIGKLKNGKVFDSNTKGKPFTFKVGAGEVIKGWDLGFEGMKVGGTRKLTIPPALAYGTRGAPPDIPANSTLDFEVKLLEIKN